MPSTLPVTLPSVQLSANDPSAVSSHGGVRGDGELGFLVPPQGLSGFRFASALQRHGIAFRLALNGWVLASGAGERRLALALFFALLTPLAFLLIGGATWALLAVIG